MFGKLQCTRIYSNLNRRNKLWLSAKLSNNTTCTRNIKTLNLLTGNTRKTIYQKLVNYNGSEFSKYCGTIIWAQTTKDIYDSDLFEGYTELEFEGNSFMSFLHYDEILTSRYGDYMKLPPENERCSHEPEAYWISEVE